MSYKFCLLALMCAFLFAACSKIGKSQTDEIVFDDKPKTTAKNEIVIDDKSFGDGQEAVSESSKIGSPGTTDIAFDQSQIRTSFDGFGNKTEDRCFENHPRLKCVMLRTAVDGKMKILVYGQNGQIKNLPENMIAKAMTARADEIANAAGIYQTYQQPAPVPQNIQPRNNAPLRPIPNYNSPVQNQQVEQIAADEVKSVADSANEKPNENKDDSSTPQTDKKQ